MMSPQEIAARLRSLAAEIDGGGTGPSLPVLSSPPVGYPRLEKISGVNMLLKAPISPLYHPSATDWMLGHLDGTQIADPSNGDEVGMPLRNVDGFPLFYPVGLDGAGKKVAVGTPAVIWGDFGEPSEAAKAANAAAWEAAMRKLQTQPQAPQPVDNSTGGIDAPGTTQQQEDWAIMIIGGSTTNAAVKAAVQSLWDSTGHDSQKYNRIIQAYSSGGARYTEAVIARISDASRQYPPA